MMTVRRTIAQVRLGALGLHDDILGLLCKCGHHAGEKDDGVWSGEGIIWRVLMGEGVGLAIL